MKTTKRGLTPFAIFLSFFVGFGVWACSCVPFDIATGINETDNIYIAKVLSITPYTGKVDFELGGQSKYTLDIQTIFKGENKEGYIVTPNNGASCGLEDISEGDKVLFYARNSRKGNPQFATLCGGTQKISDATEDLKLLKAKYPHPLHICPTDQTFRDGKCQKITSRWGRLRTRITTTRHSIWGSSSQPKNPNTYHNPQAPLTSQELLTHNRQKRHNINPSHYSFVKKTLGHNIIYSVQNNIIQVNSVMDTETRKPTTIQKHNLMTIPQVFDVIQNAIDKKAKTIQVTYDKVWGYPSTVSIDWGSGTTNNNANYTLTISNSSDDMSLGYKVLKLTHFNNKKVSYPITLTFVKNHIYSTICNRGSRTHQWKDNKLLLGTVTTTQMLCEPELMNIENAFYTLKNPTHNRKGLSNETTINLSENGNTFTFDIIERHLYD